MTRNRLLIIVGVLVVILVGLSIYAYAFISPSTAQTALSSVTPTPVPSATVATPKANKVRKIVGTIQSLSASTLVVTLSQGSETVTVSVNAKTKYTSSNSPATFSDLKVGEMVQIRARASAKDPTTLLAVSILITPSTGKISTLSGQT